MESTTIAIDVHVAQLTRALRTFLCADVSPVSTQDVEAVHHLLDCVYEHLSNCAGLDKYYTDIAMRDAENDELFDADGQCLPSLD